MGWSALPSPCLAHTVLEAAAVASPPESEFISSGLMQAVYRRLSRSGSCRRHQGNAFPGLSLQPPREVSEQGLSPAPGAAAGVGTVSPALLRAWVCILGLLRKAAEPTPDAHANVLV